MILNAVGIQTIVKKLGQSLKVKKVILIASPTQISTVVDIFSRNLALNEIEKSIFQKEIYLKSQIDLKDLDILHFERKAPTRIKYLCLHAENDKVVPYLDSKRLLKLRGRVVLKSQKKLGHLKILYAESVMQEISNFVRL